MHCQHVVSTFDLTLGPPAPSFGWPRRPAEWLVHLLGMDTRIPRQANATDRNHDSLESVLTLSELAARLCVTAQTIYDLRSRGRGPRGFRVGRQLRL